MRRRELLALLGSAIVRPGAAGAQPVPTIGYLSTLSEMQVTPQLAAFRRGLAEAGFVEGRDVAIEYRWAQGDYERLGGMAKELVQRPVSRPRRRHTRFRSFSWSASTRWPRAWSTA